MRAMDERHLETIHLYVVREEEVRPSLAPIILSVLALSILIVLCTLSPYQQPEVRKTIRIPAVPLPLQTFTTSVQIIPTGIKIYPATSAHGTLTLTNGSVLSEVLPKGIIFTGKNGIEVITQSAVFIPPGSAIGYGLATVEAKAMSAGTAGNIASLDINAVYGTSLYVRNLIAFHGGKDAYSIKVVTAQDRQIAIDNARASLAAQEAKIQAFLAFPCNETTQEKSGSLTLSLACQYVAYTVPSYMHITAVRLVERNLFIDVVFVPRPRIIQFK